MMTKREVHKTGVMITNQKLEEIKNSLSPTIQMNFKTGINITTPADPQTALEIIKNYAISKGLPELLPTFNYCLGGEDNKEIVCFKEGLPNEC